MSFLDGSQTRSFDMDILKVMSYPNSTDPSVTLWTHWHYPSDTMSPGN